MKSVLTPYANVISVGGFSKVVFGVMSGALPVHYSNARS